MADRYPSGNYLKFDMPAERILRITMSRGKMHEQDYEAHHALTEIWKHVDADPEVDIVILTGEGASFCAGGEYEMSKRNTHDPEYRMRMWKDGRDTIRNAIDFSKPIVAAINGPALGAGLAIAMMADMSIAAKSAKLIIAHTRLGVAAGDHAVMMWPMLCGMAKTRRYLLTGESVSGEEAERIGLVAMCCEDDELQDRALEYAKRLAARSQIALRLTKQAANNWLRQAWPIFEASLALEMMSFADVDAAEAVQSVIDKRDPKFVRRDF
jgi:enoyl-CoA hydratase